MQNLVVLIEPYNNHGYDAMNFEFNVTPKAAKMCFNKFCIDEEAGFEFSGVHYLKKASHATIFNEKFVEDRKTKGKGYSIIKIIITYMISANCLDGYGPYRRVS